MFPEGIQGNARAKTVRLVNLSAKATKLNMIWIGSFGLVMLFNYLVAFKVNLFNTLQPGSSSS